MCDLPLQPAVAEAVVPCANGTPPVLVVAPRLRFPFFAMLACGAGCAWRRTLLLVTESGCSAPALGTRTRRPSAAISAAANRALSRAGVIEPMILSAATAGRGSRLIRHHQRERSPRGREWGGPENEEREAVREEESKPPGSGRACGARARRDRRTWDGSGGEGERERGTGC